MRKKLTTQQKLARRKIGKPNYLIYRLLIFAIVKLMFEKKLGVNFTYKVNPKDFKGPFIVVGNHASRMDYIYSSLALLPHSMNYVVAFNEFFRSHLSFIFWLMCVIPKRNFVSDPYTIKSIKRVISKGGNICIFPEGMSSISGANQPSMIGSGKLLKCFGLPVLRLGIKGGYLTNTKYCLDERCGRVDVELDMLFTPEQLKSMDADEIQGELDRAIYHDDYAWNKVARVSFDGKGQMAKNMHDMLYWCPRCGMEFTMHGSGNIIKCMLCGNGAEVNAYYDLIPFDNSCQIPETPRVWWDIQRELVRNLVSDENFVLSERIKLGSLPQYKLLKNLKTSEITGEGRLALTRAGLQFDGVRDGAVFSFFVSSQNLPSLGIATDMSRMFTNATGEFLEFIPDSRSVAKWLLATEENHRLTGGSWKDLISTTQNTSLLVESVTNSFLDTV